MELTELKKQSLVTDRERPSYGIGEVEEVKDGLVYVWYDEIDTKIHYQESELNLLEPFEI